MAVSKGMQAQSSTFQTFGGSPLNTTLGAPVNQSSSSVVPGEIRHDFIKPGSLDTQDAKYCRCLLEVNAKGTAYSPYGVCKSRVGPGVYSCTKYYDWSAMSLDMLLSYLDLHKVDTSGITTREHAIEAIRQKLASRGESL